MRPADGTPAAGPAGAAPTMLCIVVPCYDEEAVLPLASERLSALLQRLVDAGKADDGSTVVFVDDGSRDATWSLIEREARERRRVRGLRLSRNRGHQNAVLAGLLSVDGDAVVTIDADLQDDVDAIERMLDAFRSGHDVVLGVRDDRSSDTVFKRGSAALFYRTLGALGVELVPHHADFRLLGRRAVEALRQYREVNLYLRGIVPTLGFRTGTVGYRRLPRAAGISKYPLRRMLRLAAEAVTSFSIVPLQLITVLGVLVFAGAMGVSAWVLWVALVAGRAVPGWASTVLPIVFLGGVQLLCLGVIGAYLGRIYAETKGRPRYFIDRVAGPAATTWAGRERRLHGTGPGWRGPERRLHGGDGPARPLETAGMGGT